MSFIRIKSSNPGAAKGPGADRPDDPAGGNRTSGGRVTHDARGTAIWDWAVATGVFAATKSADLLRMLDNPDLELEGALDGVPAWSGDPYNRG
jgi:hypothetical protein